MKCVCGHSLKKHGKIFGKQCLHQFCGCRKFVPDTYPPKNIEEFLRMLRKFEEESRKSKIMVK